MEWPWWAQQQQENCLHRLSRLSIAAACCFDRPAAAWRAAQDPHQSLKTQEITSKCLCRHRWDTKANCWWVHYMSVMPWLNKSCFDLPLKKKKVDIGLWKELSCLYQLWSQELCPRNLVEQGQLHHLSLLGQVLLLPPLGSACWLQPSSHSGFSQAQTGELEHDWDTQADQLFSGSLLKGFTHPKIPRCIGRKSASISVRFDYVSIISVHL